MGVFNIVPYFRFRTVCVTFLSSFWLAGIFPGKTEDHREHGTGHEATKPAAAAGQSQVVDEVSKLAVTTPLNTE